MVGKSEMCRRDPSHSLERDDDQIVPELLSYPATIGCLAQGESMEKDHLEILLEDIRSKFDLVLEGHDVLRSELRETRTELKEEIALGNFKIDLLNKKIDVVAADLAAHRADTEAHHGIYRVKET